MLWFVNAVPAVARGRHHVWPPPPGPRTLRRLQNADRWCRRIQLPPGAAVPSNATPDDILKRHSDDICNRQWTQAASSIDAKPRVPSLPSRVFHRCQPPSALAARDELGGDAESRNRCRCQCRCHVDPSGCRWPATETFTEDSMDTWTIRRSTNLSHRRDIVVQVHDALGCRAPVHGTLIFCINILHVFFLRIRVSLFTFKFISVTSRDIGMWWSGVLIHWSWQHRIAILSTCWEEKSDQTGCGREEVAEEGEAMAPANLLEVPAIRASMSCKSPAMDLIFP